MSDQNNERSHVSEISQKQATLMASGPLVSTGNSDDVRSMYEKYPYPSPILGESLIYDVSNNLGVLWADKSLEGKRILDAGCGTGQRLLGAAQMYPKAEFWGLDMTSASLDTARSLATGHKLGNVQFMQENLLDLSISQEFDIIVSTGVIHHLPDPPRGLANLSSLLAPDGVFIVWHYHSLGEHKRLYDRELFLTLWNKNQSKWEDGFQILEQLNFTLDSKRYGSTSKQQYGDGVSQTNIDVDAYMHPVVNAYRFKEAIEMFKGCDVDWVAINGINQVDTSKLIDLSEADKSEYKALNLKIEDLFEEESLQSRFRALDRRSRLAVIELRLWPTGFTILGGRGTASQLGPRIEGNVV